MKPTKEMQKMIDHIRERTGDNEADFRKLLNFKTGQYIYSMPVFYRKKKGDTFTQKEYEMSIQINYCPFSGAKLEE